MKLATITLSLFVTFFIYLHAQEEGEGLKYKAAVAYLKELGAEKYDLPGVTALSEYCESSRRQEIETQLELYHRSSMASGDIFRFAGIKTQGAFAALLLRADNNRTPLNVRIHCIAMINRDGTWLPAPLPGSFNNSNYGYDPASEEAVKSLEKWMALEKTRLETKGKKEALHKLLNEISERQKKIDFNPSSPEKSVLQLIHAMQTQDRPGALFLTGIHSEKFPDLVETTVNTVTQGLLIDEADNDWAFMLNSSIITKVLKVNNIKNEVAVGFWDPLSSAKSKVFYFPFFKSEGSVFTQLPATLKTALLPQSNRKRWKSHRSDENELKKRIPVEIFKQLHAAIHKDKQKLIASILEFHKKQNFKGLLSLLPKQDDYFADEFNQRKILIEISQLWSTLHSVKAQDFLSLSSLEERNISLTSIQFDSINPMREPSPINLWMIQLDDNWHLIPKKILADYGDAKLVKTMTKLSAQSEAAQKEFLERKNQEPVTHVIPLQLPLLLPAPSPQDAQKTLLKFRNHLRSKSSIAALSNCVILKASNRAEIMKQLHNSLRGATDHNDPDKVIGYTQSKHWTGITLRTISKSSKVADYPLYLIVDTAKGARILFDIDLRYATNRGRKILNTKTWKKLSNTLPEASLLELNTLFKAHQKFSSEDILKNNPKEE